jgi:hypothetical protein
MINRRAFMGALGGVGMLTANELARTAAEKRRVFILEQYFFKTCHSF